ncbi:hypothetical protein T08_11344 [Trichinella sp. T8]|nr:hypothetical protein T08_11960 [Trichinella sp. T8]KRZ87679.1 hypothetical protein T08_11344 [Trichinella sp. T8]
MIAVLSKLRLCKENRRRKLSKLCSRFVEKLYQCFRNCKEDRKLPILRSRFVEKLYKSQS